MKNIILASKSPRRRELFSLITPNFECTVAPVDESLVIEKSGAELCESLARLKCSAVARQNPNGVVIGCDTVVEIANKILGKPHSKNEAKSMISMLSGNVHKVFTGVCIGHMGTYYSFFCCTNVSFFNIPDYAIEEYVATEEPYDKAGGYGIQGWMAKYLNCIDGDYFNVMGLPVSRVYAELLAHNFV